MSNVPFPEGITWLDYNTLRSCLIAQLLHQGNDLILEESDEGGKRTVYISQAANNLLLNVNCSQS